MLPTTQEAATNLVRAIATATPVKQIGGPGQWRPEAWWYMDRRHGTGDTPDKRLNPHREAGEHVQDQGR